MSHTYFFFRHCLAYVYATMIEQDIREFSDVWNTQTSLQSIIKVPWWNPRRPFYAASVKRYHCKATLDVVLNIILTFLRSKELPVLCWQRCIRSSSYKLLYSETFVLPWWIPGCCQCTTDVVFWFSARLHFCWELWHCFWCPYPAHALKMHLLRIVSSFWHTHHALTIC